MAQKQTCRLVTSMPGGDNESSVYLTDSGRMVPQREE
ncbi:hypothetical protein BofuT4_uP154470.1 [Botrytis cinerea T4]|uniref:Uncharacterized protein n=1 Tax=Botryotinia fuckeliana (strain T4) TaxID=999810 RepID=G2YVI7_BOTF4|nr:hypothetical protein BofuT4_uP154470.1 [Botrytis cinerea T4]